jgi:hypothetical protein
MGVQVLLADFNVSLTSRDTPFFQQLGEEQWLAVFDIDLREWLAVDPERSPGFCLQSSKVAVESPTKAIFRVEPPKAVPDDLKLVGCLNVGDRDPLGLFFGKFSITP